MSALVFPVLIILLGVTFESGYLITQQRLAARLAAEACSRAVKPTRTMTPLDSVIVVSGSYSFTPFYFGTMTGPITFSHVVTLNPFFSRSYRYQAEDSDWNYYNVQ